MDRPLTPRLLTAREAAAYFRLPLTQFQKLRLGEVRLGSKTLYDRHALDAYLDQVSGLARDAHGPDEAEAALARFAARPGGPAGRP